MREIEKSGAPLFPSGHPGPTRVLRIGKLVKAAMAFDLPAEAGQLRIVAR